MSKSIDEKFIDLAAELSHLRSLATRVTWTCTYETEEGAQAMTALINALPPQVRAEGAEQ